MEIFMRENGMKQPIREMVKVSVYFLTADFLKDTGEMTITTENVE
jgi:hypothetical protein